MQSLPLSDDESTGIGKNRIFYFFYFKIFSYNVIMRDKLQIWLAFVLFYFTLQLLHNQEITYENQSCQSDTHERNLLPPTEVKLGFLGFPSCT
jgi:hypothetical protein